MGPRPCLGGEPGTTARVPLLPSEDGAAGATRDFSREPGRSPLPVGGPPPEMPENERRSVVDFSF